MYKAHQRKMKSGNLEDEEEKDNNKSAAKNNPMVMLASSMEERDAKIAQFKLKKQIEANLDSLKDYKDESMQREFYLMQVKFSILKAFEQLNMTQMEMNVLEHRA